MKIKAFLFTPIAVIFIVSLCSAQDLSAKQTKHEARVAALKKLNESPVFDDFEDRTKEAVKDDQGLCALHHVELKKLFVPILYGHIVDFKEIDRGEFFPNATDWAMGGCVISPSNKQRALVFQCSRCIEVREERWLNFVKSLEAKKVRNKI
jgi:hypothetical protein